MDTARTQALGMHLVLILVTGLLASQLLVASQTPSTPVPVAGESTTPWGSDYFPNTLLTDQDGRQVPLLPPPRPHARYVFFIRTDKRPLISCSLSSPYYSCPSVTYVFYLSENSYQQIATGGSAIKAIETLIDYGVAEERILFLNLISCPEGIAAVVAKFPAMKIVTAEIDAGLDEKLYINPGLGDFGCRYFGTDK